MGAERQHLQTLAETDTGEGGCDDRFFAALLAARTLLLGRASMLAGDGSLAEDFVQMTYERALRACHRPPFRDLQPWLLRILRNVAIDHWRSAAVRQSCELDAERTATPPAAAPRPWWHDLELADLQRAANDLPPTFRELFLLRLAGCSNNEIARRLGLTVTTVGTRFFRGRRWMQRALAVSCRVPSQS
jgi:RNA polymerase sigma factor (sigma-70 family)